MKKALIIDDEESIADIFEELLKLECGVDEVDRAVDGLEGFLKLMTNQYDIICLDQMMPYVHGTEVLSALRNKPGLNKDTPVLFISAYIPQIPENLKQSEHTFYLEKPVDFPRFIRYVKMSIKK